VKGGKKSPFLLQYFMQNTDIEKLVEKGLLELEFTDVYIVDLKVNNNKIEVFLDSDEGITFLKCQRLSRFLEAIFDESKIFGEKYTLDVSSAGVGSSLKYLKQYKKNIGRTIEVKYADNQKTKGKLKDVVDNLIYVEYETKVKEGKKNKKVIIVDEVKFEDIIESKIKISFN